MTTVAVSMSEIRREGPWALRALGFAFGVADRATPLLVWTEAVHGSALAWLRSGETGIVASTAGPGIARSDDPAGGRSLDAGGRCLIEAGPPAVDLATRDARTGGLGHVTVTNVAGLLFTGALCNLAASRGLGVVAVHASGPGEIAADRFATRGWIAAVPGEPVPHFLAGAPDDGAERVLSWIEAAGLVPGAAARKWVAADFDRIAGPGREAGGFFGLTLIRPDARTAAVAVPAADLPIVDWPQRVARAHREGVNADAADYRHLYALEERTWAPASDRSRRQAAF